MSENFEQYLKRYIPGLIAEQIELIQKKCIARKLRRRDMLLHEGEVCRHKIFVLQGLLRMYNIGSDGSEHVIKFTTEHQFTVDPESYNNGTPSKYNIEAIEPTEAILWTHEDFESLRAVIPALNTFSEKVISQNMSATQQRLLMSISATAEEKYLDFVQSFPDVFSRVPLHMVASYLGVSRETLTRIRQGLAVASL